MAIQTTAGQINLFCSCGQGIVVPVNVESKGLISITLHVDEQNRSQVCLGCGQQLYIAANIMITERGNKKD